MIFAADGSGGHSMYAGYGVVAYNEVDNTSTYYCGRVESYKILDARLTSEYRLDISYDKNEVVGATNNRGELCAIYCALLVAKSLNVKDIIIITDSKYCIGIFTGWYENWVRDNILHKKKNIDIIEKIYVEYQVVNVTFIHQKAHMPERDIRSLTGTDLLYARLNQKADDLANRGKTT